MFEQSCISSPASWADAQFRHASLDHLARTKRLINMGTRVAEHPHGLISEVFEIPKERTGAYRFLENPWIFYSSIVDSFAEASWRNAQSYLEARQPLLVASDFTSLSFRDPSNRKGLGGTSTAKNSQSPGSLGMLCVESILMTNSGSPLGLVDLSFWLRDTKPKHRKRSQTPAYQRQLQRQLPFESKETFNWKRTADHVLKRLQPSPYQLWFQWDRGADGHEVLNYIDEIQQFFTLRLAQDRLAIQSRSLDRDLHKRRQKSLLRTIKSALALAPVRCRGEVQIPRSGHQPERVAEVEIRWMNFTIGLYKAGRKQPYKTVEMPVVWCREIGSCGEGVPLSWYLLTNRPVTGIASALEVIRNYSYRWRTEDFHRCWKSVCRVEKSELRSAQALMLWATILAGAAMRVERLKHRSRSEPDIDALEELSEAEIKAVTMKLQPQGYNEGDEVTLSQAVEWIAMLGGWSRNHTQPPGAVVIERGLRRIESLAIILNDYDLVPKEKSG